MAAYDNVDIYADIEEGNVVSRSSSAVSFDVVKETPDADKPVYVHDHNYYSQDTDVDDAFPIGSDLKAQLDLALPREAQQLSDVFKSHIGLWDIDDDRIQTLTHNKENILSRYRFTSFTQRRFQDGHVPRSNVNQLLQPLLVKADLLDVKASLSLWRAMQRFVNSPQPRQDAETRKTSSPVMMQVCWTFEPRRSTSSTSSSCGTPSPLFEINNNCNKENKNVKTRKPSLRALKDIIQSSIKSRKGRTKSGDNPQMSFDNDVMFDEVKDIDAESCIPHTDLDIIHYIIAHGIVRKELRDEIYCQLCCLVTDSTSPEKVERGWMLHALCSGCFLPTSDLVNYYYSFLHDAPEKMADYATYIFKMLARTNANGMRYHPPNWAEFQAVKERKCVTLQVGLLDGRKVQVSADSSTTASEICATLATTLGLTDHFGFSIYVAVQNKVSSLGSGNDHVMDAITECEQLIRIEGKSEKDAPWRVFYRKELFTPWHDAITDPIATDLVYKQIIDGIRREEYALPTTEELNTMISRFMYIDCGPDLDHSEIKSKLSEYYPESILSRSSKGRDIVAESVMTVFKLQGLTGRPMTDQHMKANIVAEATTLWPMNFSAMFEAFRYDKPKSPLVDVIVAINRDGIFVLDNRYEVIIGFHYYDVIDISSTSCDDARQSYIRLTIIDRAQYSFFSPNSSTIAKMTSVFLDGLRRRSKWVVSLQPFVLQDYSKDDNCDLRLRKGDLVHLQDVPQDTPSIPYVDWMYGQCVRTGVSGFFPNEVIYVLPTAEKPAEDFITMLGTTMNQALIDTLPRRHRLGSVVYSDETKERRNVLISKHSIGRYSGHGIESFA